MTRQCKLILFFFMLVSAPLAVSSTPESWKQFSEDMRKACLSSSSLQAPHALGNEVSFDDQLGYSALLLSGTYPQPFMKGAFGRELCLYDRATKKVFITSADELINDEHAHPAMPAKDCH